MGNLSNVNTEERPQMIILGVLTLYFLICGFILYLYFLHRVTFLVTLVVCILFTIIYTPQFLILKKIKTKDKIKIVDDFLLINGEGIAFADIVNFRVEECKLTPSRLKYSLNRLLDETMYIKDVIEVGEDFDSRYDAKEKTYLYIVNLNELDPIRSDLEYTPLFKPDIKVLEETLNLYVGKHDFSSFTSEKDDDPIKTIKSVSLDITSSNRIEIRIKGTSFLRYQVRFMVGAALEVASYRLDKIELINRLNGTTKSVLKYKAPAKALYLEKVEYDFKRCENVKS